MTWAMYEDEGPADRWIREAVDAVIGPHLAATLGKSLQPKTPAPR